jgi:predicted phage baseplate assembly protein
VLWREVPRFYGKDVHELIYIIRQNDQGDSLITFGDGVRGMRLTTGARVVGSYFFGAGEAAPPARTITQMVTPVKGVTALVNPIGAFGGADAEDEANMKKYAPRSALMLGRAVSLVDYEALAAATSGVRAAKAEWLWSGVQQRPVVKIWYIGEGSLGTLISDRLSAISAEGVPFEVEAAKAINVWLHVSLQIDPDYLADLVMAAVVSVLTEALAPEKLGIGAVLFRSKVLALAAGVAGVSAPTGLYINGLPYLNAGYRPPLGTYIEFTNITAGV